MRTLTTVLCTVVLASASHAQVVTIDPGMTQAQVVAKLGEPASSRSYDGHTYLYYKNGCEKKCGMQDLVVLDSGKVTDAIFRAANRKYSGTSSSPRMIPAEEAKKDAKAETLKMPAQPKKPTPPPNA